MKYSRNLSVQSDTPGRMHRGILMPALVCLLCLFVGAGSVSAQISIVGVSDEEIYVDSVSFIVNSEAGYDYTVELNGVSIPTDVYIEVDEAEYYELYVYRREQSSGNEETELVQFIVRASERGETEVGLPVWTPYPMIDSAAAEFSGAQLQIVCPNDYPIGLEIPIIARVENGTGERVGVNGYVTAYGFEDYPLQLFRGVGSAFLPPASQAGPVSYTAQIQTLQTPKQINIEGSTTWQTVSSDITSSVNWGEDARIRITAPGDEVLTISAAATLTIGAGSVIIIDPDISIQVLGQIIVNGTLQKPVVFTAQDRDEPWGGFLFETSSSVGQFTGAIFTASGADPGWFNNNHSGDFTHHDEECLFYLSDSADVTLTDCYAVENYGQLGHGEGGYITMTGCLVQKFVTGGQYNGGAVIGTDSAFIEFPSAYAPFVDYDNDAFYLNGGPHSFTDCLFGWTLDDGIDAGQGTAGSVNLEGCWFESCIHEGQAWSSGPRYGDVNNTVVLNCGQAIEAGYDDPFIDVINSLCTSNVIGARFGDNYVRTYNGFLDVKDSLLLFNVRDVWGRAWDDWTLHLSQMDIQDNYLSAANVNHPNNTLWDANDPNHLSKLEPFLPTPAGTVGIGIATLEDTYALSELSDKVPVRLSTFTTNFVSVDYTIYTEDGLYDSGSLQFIPGETVKQIEYVLPSIEELKAFRIVLSNPVNADITRHKEIIYMIPYEIVEQLIQEGDEWHYFKGNTEPSADWNQLGFTMDGSWLLGATGIGYEGGSGYEGCIATNLSDMQNNYISVYARREFFIEDPCRLTSLTFSIDFDDGYIAYLNGIPVDSQFPPSPVAHDQPASTGNHEACCGTSAPSGPCPPEQVDLSGYISELTAGYNVLAVQVHNTTLGSSDFIFIPELFGVLNPRLGDFEPDGDVDFDDFAEFALWWLQTECGNCGHADLTGDGNVNHQDLQEFCDNWLAGL